MDKRDRGPNERESQNEIRGHKVRDRDPKRMRMRVRHKLGEKVPERDWEEMVWKNNHDMKFKKKEKLF